MFQRAGVQFWKEFQRKWRRRREMAFLLRQGHIKTSRWKGKRRLDTTILHLSHGRTGLIYQVSGSLSLLLHGCFMVAASLPHPTPWGKRVFFRERTAFDTIHKAVKTLFSNLRQILRSSDLVTFCRHSSVPAAPSPIPLPRRGGGGATVTASQ